MRHLTHAENRTATTPVEALAAVVPTNGSAFGASLLRVAPPTPVFDRPMADIRRLVDGSRPTSGFAAGRDTLSGVGGEVVGRSSSVSARQRAGNTRVRIGAVSYLNSKPLVEGLAELLPDADLVLDYPSRLADALRAGELDVALIPSVEALRGRDYQIVSDACVAARGAVRSVKLYSRVPLADIRSLALDQGSRTSAALVQVILSEQFGVRPRLESLPLDADTTDTLADAILLIGDRAMTDPDETFCTTLDLGEEWNRWTGLPFVFAMWVARPGVDIDAIAEGLVAARDLGLERVRAIAERESRLLKLPFESVLSYLTRNLHYRLGSAERSGLRWFGELAGNLELVPRGANLVFRNFASAR